MMKVDAVLALATLTSLNTFGCSPGAQNDEPQLDSPTSTQELIGGFAAEDSTFDAVGSVSTMASDLATGVASFTLSCTGFLIGESTVVTAKHCVTNVKKAQARGIPSVFSTGARTQQPKRWSAIASVEVAPGDSGGFLGVGHDIGVLHLIEPLAEVPVLRFASFSEARPDADFYAISYGSEDVLNQQHGRRRIGAMPFNTSSGFTYEALFGSFDEFYQYATGQSLPTDCANNVAVSFQKAGACAKASQARLKYESTRLEQTDEAVLGLRDTTTQPCFGDSGGPLLQKDAGGRLTAYGVLSSTIGERSTTCKGAVYATFTPLMIRFLQAEANWTDPCEGLTTEGSCQGSVIRRCTTINEGSRGVAELDCAHLGLTCVDTDAGLGCGSSKLLPLH